MSVVLRDYIIFVPEKNHETLSSMLRNVLWELVKVAASKQNKKPS